MDNGKFVFRNLLAKRNVKNIGFFCSLINFLAMKIALVKRASELRDLR